MPRERASSLESTRKEQSIMHPEFFAEEQELLDAVVEQQHDLSREDVRYLVSRTFEHSLEDGLRLARRLQLTGSEIMETVAEPRVLLKHEHFADELSRKIGFDAGPATLDDPSNRKFFDNAAVVRTELNRAGERMVTLEDLDGMAEFSKPKHPAVKEMAEQLDQHYAQYLVLRKIDNYRPDSEDSRSQGQKIGEQYLEKTVGALERPQLGIDLSGVISKERKRMFSQLGAALHEPGRLDIVAQTEKAMAERYLKDELNTALNASDHKGYHVTLDPEANAYEVKKKELTPEQQAEIEDLQKEIAAELSKIPPDINIFDTERGILGMLDQYTDEKKANAAMARIESIYEESGITEMPAMGDMLFSLVSHTNLREVFLIKSIEEASSFEKTPQEIRMLAEEHGLFVDPARRRFFDAEMEEYEKEYKKTQEGNYEEKMSLRKEFENSLLIQGTRGNESMISYVFFSEKNPAIKFTDLERYKEYPGLFSPEEIRGMVAEHELFESLESWKLLPQGNFEDSVQEYAYRYEAAMKESRGKEKLPREFEKVVQEYEKYLAEDEYDDNYIKLLDAKGEVSKSKELIKKYIEKYSDDWMDNQGFIEALHEGNHEEYFDTLMRYYEKVTDQRLRDDEDLYYGFVELTKWAAKKDVRSRHMARRIWDLNPGTPPDESDLRIAAAIGEKDMVAQNIEKGGIYLPSALDIAMDAELGTSVLVDRWLDTHPSYPIKDNGYPYCLIKLAKKHPIEGERVLKHIQEKGNHDSVVTLLAINSLNYGLGHPVEWGPILELQQSAAIFKHRDTPYLLQLLVFEGLKDAGGMLTQNETILSENDQQKLRLLNLVRNFDKEAATDYLQNESEFSSEYAQDAKVQRRNFHEGSNSLRQFLQDVMETEKGRKASLETVPAKPLTEAGEKMIAREIARMVVPAPESAPRSMFENWFGGFGGSGSYEDGVQDPYSAFQSSKGEQFFGGGDPLEAKKKGYDPEIMRFREPVNEMLVSNLLGSYQPDRRTWKRVEFPVAYHPIESAESTVTLPLVRAGSSMALPKTLSSRIIPERVFERTQGGDQRPLELSTNAMGEVTVSPSRDVAEVVYSMERSLIPELPTDMDNRQYAKFREQFVQDFDREGSMVEKMATLPTELELFAMSIEELPPHERLVHIEEFVRSIGYYDFDNSEVNRQKADRSLEEQFMAMKMRMDELKTRDPQVAELGKGKMMAGVCHDFALVTTALMRRSGFVSGYASGYQPEGMSVKLSGAHSTSFAVMPHEMGGNKVILVDATPGGLTPEQDAMLAGISGPSLRERVKKAGEVQESIHQESLEKLAQLETLIGTGDPEKLKELANGKLEQALNLTLRYQVERGHLEAVKRMLESYWYTPVSKADPETLAGTIEIAQFFDREISATRSTATPPSEEFKRSPGTELMNTVRSFAEKFKKAGTVRNEREAYRLIDMMAETAARSLDPVEERALRLITTYLKAEKKL